jgi:toxin-antitoxin system PIN domain toxin
LIGTWLLDVNVLLAWLWPTHEAHKAASKWMRDHHQQPWATCPVTEMGFLRIVTNRSFSANAPQWAEAVAILREQTERSAGHVFWHDSLSLGDIDDGFGSRIKGPSQITDAYLLSMAVHEQGRFVTFDYRAQTLAPEGSPDHDALVILHP